LTFFIIAHNFKTMFRLSKNNAEIRAAMQDSLPDDENISIFVEKAVVDGHDIAAAATEKHLLLYFKGLLKQKYIFYQISKFKDIALEESFRTSTLDITLSEEGKLHITRLPKSEARIMSGFIRKIILKADAKAMVMGKPCPYCCEIIKATAKVCPHCQRELP
jgi:hypothetical protein